jgi:hypothetical protein
MEIPPFSRDEPEQKNIKRVKVSPNMNTLGMYSEASSFPPGLFDKEGSLLAKIPTNRGGLRETRQVLQSYQKDKQRQHSGLNSNSREKEKEPVQKNYH